MDSSRAGIDIIPLLGLPVRAGGDAKLRRLAQRWGRDFPADFLEISGGYGDTVISDFIFFCGPNELESYAALMGDVLGDTRVVPCRVLPSPGGALLWGNTIEGDQLFLVDRGQGRWTVSAFRRNWGDWLDTDMEFGEWFPRVLAGEIEIEWMPEWPSLPHALVLCV